MNMKGKILYPFLKKKKEVFARSYAYMLVLDLNLVVHNLCLKEDVKPIKLNYVNYILQ